jgi:hypothetical protein
MGDQRTRALVSRGSFGFNFTAGAYPFLSLSYTGLLPASPAVDGTAPGGVLDFTRWKDPLEVNLENTSFTVGGFAAVMKEFSADANAEVKLRNLVGSRYVQRGNHAMTCRIVCEAPAIGTKNYFTNLDVGDEIAVNCTHGVGAGKIVQVDANYLEILKITRSEEDDKLMLSMDCGLNIRAGQDDLLLTAK